MNPSFSRLGAFSVDQIDDLYLDSEKNLSQFWLDQAKSFVSWSQVPKKAESWKDHRATWFEDGRLNVSYNCVDRHALNPKTKNKRALTWESEDGRVLTFTYAELLQEVQTFAAVLSCLQLKPLDTVTIYLPLMPEAVFAMLACARLGITHSVVFAGFGAEAIAERNKDSGAKVVITADEIVRKGQNLPLKANVDRAMELDPAKVENILVIKRTGAKVFMQKERDVYFSDLARKTPVFSSLEFFSSEHPLFILYTSGSTGKPKGLVHTCGGYLTSAAFSTALVFDLHDSDLYWCTADIGWITGHTYGVYGPLALGGSIFLYEGAPLHPQPDRFWDIVARHKITILYTAPTAIRTFMKLGDEWIAKHDLSSLRLLGSVGEPINPEAWHWYFEQIGRNLCPIVDTWWQTETGSMMISPIPGYSEIVPGSAVRPLPGIKTAIVDKSGIKVKPQESGFLIIEKIWPSIARTIINDHARYKEQYWSQMQGRYFTGDGARQDEKNNYWILGRIDDVLNVSGHRLSTAEIESALVSHLSVAEAAVIGKYHEIKGEAVVCFVTLKSSQKPSLELKDILTKHVAIMIGAFARPDEIRFVDALPKTRSGKIVRRLLREIVNNTHKVGDMTTLEDTSVLDKLREDEN